MHLISAAVALDAQEQPLGVAEIERYIARTHRGKTAIVLQGEVSAE